MDRERRSGTKGGALGQPPSDTINYLAIRVRPMRTPGGAMSQLAVVGAPCAADEETRRILRAAWAVLDRSHFRSLKIRQVLTASNTSASTFYRHFPSKSHLLLALLADETRRGDRRLAECLPKADSA